MYLNKHVSIRHGGVARRDAWRVFRSFSIGRMILTKKPWIFDPNGDSDRDEITDQYKNKEGMNSFFTLFCYFTLYQSVWTQNSIV